MTPHLDEELDQIQQQRQARIQAAYDRNARLREELAECRQIGKAIRHRRRMELLAQQQEEDT